MPDTPDLTAATQVVAALVPQVRDEHLPASTPCEDYRVQDLLFHLIGLTAAFRDAARKILGPTTQTPPDDAQGSLPEDWRTVLPDRLGELAEAWNEPSAWEGQTTVGGVQLPGAVAGLFALDEVVVHGWDLAAATGQDYQPPADALHQLLGFLEPQQDPATRPPIFGPVVQLPADAPLRDHVLGLTGRDPQWNP